MDKKAAVPGTDQEPDGHDVQEVALSCARALEGVTEGYPFTPKLLVLKGSGRVFLVVTEDDERIITLKAQPDDVDCLVQQFPTIKPGRYFDKRHWVSLAAGADITPELVEELVQDSYDLATEGIDPSTGKRRKK